MLDSIYHMTLKILKNHIFQVKTSFMHCYNGCHNVSRKSVNHSWFIDFIARRYITPRRDVM